MITDSELIDSLGGAKEVARKLGLASPGGQCRVLNWKRRGIPPKVKLENPWIFLAVKKQKQAEELAETSRSGA